MSYRHEDNMAFFERSLIQDVEIFLTLNFVEKRQI